jgi:NADH-quinone oxidoreductase subunit J
LCYLYARFGFIIIACSLPVTFESVLFFLVAGCALSTAMLMVIQRNPVMSAIYLIANFFCIALLYLFLNAQLLAVLQIVVYTGAIMVLVVFVIMLLNLGDETRLGDRFDVKRGIGVVLVAGFLLEMLYIVFGSGTSFPSSLHERSEELGTVESMGRVMFSKHLLPFEITSLLLLAAILGAVVLAKRRTT